MATWAGPPAWGGRPRPQNFGNSNPKEGHTYGNVGNRVSREP